MNVVSPYVLFYAEPALHTLGNVTEVHVTWRHILGTSLHRRPIAYITTAPTMITATRPGISGATKSAATLTATHTTTTVRVAATTRCLIARYVQHVALRWP